MKNIKTELSNAKIAAGLVSQTNHRRRQTFLRILARGLRYHKKKILAFNHRDTAKFDQSDPMFDRLLLTAERIETMARDMESLIKTPDPIGQIYDSRVRYGMKMFRKRVPFGVIGIVYESRPNVTTDVIGICLKAGNAVILKGGSEAKYSYHVLLGIIRQALKKSKLPIHAVQMLPSHRKDVVMQLISADRDVDLIIPRGGKALIDFVRSHATVPVIETGAGVCHTFVDLSANLRRSAEVVFNAKTQRPSVCNSLDTLLVHQRVAEKFLAMVSGKLLLQKVEIFADKGSYNILKKQYPLNLLQKAHLADFGREFLSQKMSIKLVSNLKDAVMHINKYSSRHSEAILTESDKNKKYFIQNVDAAVVYTNASTRFSDGAIFGLGSEIGNSTQKLHARGPMGPAEVTTYKWIVAGQYSVRPD